MARQKRKLEHRAPVDLGWLVQECVDTARTRHHLAEDAIAIVGDDLQSPLVVNGDVEDLRTAIANLLDNAVKYSERPAADRGAGRRRDAGHGVGARQGSPASAFRRRSSAASSIAFIASSRCGSKVKGTGLGLYIVRSIAKRHGGRVFAESVGRRQGLDVHARTAAGQSRPERASARERAERVEGEPHPDRRRRGAPRRRPALQPRSRRPRGRRRRRRPAGARSRCSPIARATTPWSST